VTPDEPRSEPTGPEALEAVLTGSPTGTLTGKQRRFLRAKAHPLKPLVQVGEGGISEAVVAATVAVLADHELVKIRLQQPDDKKAAARQLASATGAELCGLVGHTVILYRPRAEDPVIVLPTRD
jgi:RNA-binding protein